MSRYSDRFDKGGEEISLLEPVPGRRLHIVPQDQEDEQAWLDRQATYVLTREQEAERQRQHELDAALLFLKWLVSEGERGCFPGKVIAAARAGRTT